MYARSLSVTKRPMEKVSAKGMMPHSPDIASPIGMASSACSDKKAMWAVPKRTQQANEMNGPNLFHRVLGANMPVITPPTRPAAKGLKTRSASRVIETSSELLEAKLCLLFSSLITFQNTKKVRQFVGDFDSPRSACTSPNWVSSRNVGYRCTSDDRSTNLQPSYPNQPRTQAGRSDVRASAPFAVATELAHPPRCSRTNSNRPKMQDGERGPENGYLVCQPDG